MQRLAIATSVALATAAAAVPRPAVQLAEVRTDDVARFFRLYDAAGGAPDGETLQRDYIDAGSDGVRQFVAHRIVSGAALAATIRRDRAPYEGARRCMAALPAVKARLRPAFARLRQLDPAATFPPVTILIGANNSGGTTGPAGVLIGLEVACRSSWLQPDLADRLVHLVAHEYGHVEQAPALNDEDAPTTVLRQSLIEGTAELVGELISGEVSNVHLARWTRGREREIGERFLADADKADVSAWLYNGVGTPERPGDLGYWVGYRIARGFYDQAGDKRAALATLLELKDPRAVLAASGWTPGTRG